MQGTSSPKLLGRQQGWEHPPLSRVFLSVSLSLPLPLPEGHTRSPSRCHHPTAPMTDTLVF